MSAETWLIEPRDPIIVRDGRPFNNTPGARAKSLDFPFPSTTTGGARTRAGIGSKSGVHVVFDKELVEKVKALEVRGPLLAELSGAGGDPDYLAPAPADCFLTASKGTNSTLAHLLPLVPLIVDAGCMTNLPAGLSPVGVLSPTRDKQHSGTPRFWYWNAFEKWLVNPAAIDVDLKILGHTGPRHEQRTHVGIDGVTFAGREGALFQTQGLEFAGQRRNNSKLACSQLALAIEVEDLTGGFVDAIREGLAPLGGERRIVAWRKSPRPFPGCPQEVRDGIVATSSCRVLLLTPALLSAGMMPHWLQAAPAGVKVRAIAANRPHVISGWDFAERKPKPTRRMLPAGSVLFLEMSGGSSVVSKWIDDTWMRCVSDEEQDRKDGFGLAALGVWDGKCHKVNEVLS
jgi:CRISPR-associated protein Cmr3